MLPAMINAAALRRFPRIVSLALLCLAPLCALAGCEPDPTPDLQETFDNYIAAKQAGNGEAVLNLIDPKNVEHYDSLVSAAKSAKYDRISGMQASEKLRIAYLRAKLQPEDFKDLDGRKLVLLETKGHLDADDQDRPELTLDEVKHRAPRATAKLGVNGETSNIVVEFVQVDGKWLMNAECFDQLFDKRAARVAKMLNTTEDVLIVRLVSRMVGHEVHMSIFDTPPK
jgi:hypothetical protein